MTKKKYIENTINLIVYASFFILWFLISSYYFKKYYIPVFFTPIKNFVNNYNVFTIYQKEIEIIKEDWNTILLWIKENKWENTNNKIRYINVKDKQFPIIDVISYSDKWKNIFEILDDLINYWFIIKYDNILITHSSWKWILWTYWIKNFKEWDIIEFEDELWNKIKYKAIKLFIMEKEKYEETFEFLKKYVYLITCYPIGDNKKRWILVLEEIKNKQNE